MFKRKSKREFIVSIPTGPKPVTVDDVREMRQWCSERFGPGGRNSKYKWRYGWVERTSENFYFRKEHDAMMFVLRWA